MNRGLRRASTVKEFNEDGDEVLPCGVYDEYGVLDERTEEEVDRDIEKNNEKIRKIYEAMSIEDKIKSNLIAMESLYKLSKYIDLGKDSRYEMYMNRNLELMKELVENTEIKSK
jgi:hypothetical protein